MNDELDLPQAPVDAPVDAALDAWLGDVVSAVDDEVQHANVPWDFAAMLARAHALDPEAVPAEMVREAEQAEPVISLAQRRTQRATRDDPAFAQLVADVRVANEHDAALRMNGVMPMPQRRSGGLVRLAIATVALAAAVVLAFGVVEGVQMLRNDDAPPADAALHQGDASDTAPERAVIDDSGPRAAMRVAPLPIVGTAEPETKPEPAPSVAPRAIVPARSSQSRKPKTVDVAVPLPSLSERLAALDGEAHAAWKAGDFAGAESKFEALIDLAGKTRLADLAYGDLFTLARRRGDAKREVALWKRYLAAFAKGRFVDDARAGLCRRDATDQGACWREYLADFPEGSYRAQAERDLGSKP